MGLKRLELGSEATNLGSEKPDLGLGDLIWGFRGMIWGLRGLIWSVRCLIYGVKGFIGAMGLIRSEGGGRKTETGENRPVWNHRSSAPPGPLPKKEGTFSNYIFNIILVVLT